jgi:hypothetical protein
MKKWIAALALGAFIGAPSLAADAKKDDMLNYLVLGASADSWNVWNATAKVIDDPGVQAGKATRITAHKSANSWDAQASITLTKPLKKGDVVMIAYYARVATPPAGSATALIPSAGIGLNKAPYSSFASEAAAFGSKWAVYYTSGVADADYNPGTLNFGIQLAAADQEIDLGPAFVFDFGPDYDRTKLPHNKMPVAAPPPPVAGLYDGDLAKLRARLPVPGTLINADPGTAFTYGPDVTSAPITAPEIAGGKALRTITAKPGVNPWDDGASTPVTTAVKKGDVVLAAVLIRISEPATGATAGLISELGVHLTGAPYTAIATASATAPKGVWTWIYASGTAAADYPVGAVSFGMQLGCCKQTVDVGPIFVLDLGPGIDTAKLPNNFGKPF